MNNIHLFLTYWNNIKKIIKGKKYDMTFFFLSFVYLR